MKILVLNAGSSSLKWQLFDMPSTEPLASGLIEGITEKQAFFHISFQNKHIKTEHQLLEHRSAFRLLFDRLAEQQVINIEEDLDGFGHRVVHGGELFSQPTFIDVSALQELKTLNTLAPLHNPANVLGIEIAQSLAPNIPNIAVFDTAFHQSMPEHAFLYALPTTLYKEHSIRRYGFHGTSHHYLLQQTSKKLNIPTEKLNIITLHLGNGASACAIKNGESIDTSMGFTPLEGLVMGTRSGDLDPAIVTYLMQEKKITAQEVTTLLNKESGLKGLCGENDIRVILKRSSKGDQSAALALEIFSYRIKKYIGAYIAVLGRLDAIVFSGGIGEHASILRAQILEGLDAAFGIFLDTKKNSSPEKNSINQDQSRCKLLVIATNEELQIAQESHKVIKLL